MNIKRLNEVMIALQRGIEEAERELKHLPGYQGLRINARFRDEGGRKGHDVLLDSEGNVTVQPQSYTPPREGRAS